MDSYSLDGVTVVEIGTAIAGPYATKVLGDYGAEVIKVEPPWGDNYRHRPGWYSDDPPEGFTHKFIQYNTSKKSVSIDLKTEEGSAIFRDLLADADVLVENMRAGKLEALGYDWETLHDLNDELIYCSITGYGEDGPYSDYPAYDQAMQGVTGWVHQSNAGDRPEMLLLPGIDHLTSLYAIVGVLMALVERGVSGTGQQVEVSMLEAALSVYGHHWAEYASCQSSGREPRFLGSMAPEGVFETADGYMTMVVLPEEWAAFCEAIDRPEYADDDHQFATLERRFDNREALQDALDAVLRERPTAEWIEYFLPVPGTVCAPVNHLTDLPDDPHLSHRSSVQQRTHPVMGEYLTTAPVVRQSRSTADLSEAPAQGAHTDEVLQRLGYPEARIADLRDAEVIR